MAAYPKCRKLHIDIFHRETGAFFKCGKVGHMIKDFPDMKIDQMAKHTNGKPRPKIQGHVYVMTKKGGVQHCGDMYYPFIFP